MSAHPDAVTGLHWSIHALKRHIGAIQTGKRQGGSTKPITDCINDLPDIVRRLEASEFEIEAAFEEYEDGARPSLEMVSIPRGPAVADPNAFDDCLACNSPSLEPATTKLSKNLGQLKSLEPPASDELSGISGELPLAPDVAGWRLVPVEPTPEMMNAAPASYSPSMKLMWPSICGDIYRAMIAAAPPHPASKEVGDE